MTKKKKKRFFGLKHTHTPTHTRPACAVVVVAVEGFHLSRVNPPFVAAVCCCFGSRVVWQESERERVCFHFTCAFTPDNTQTQIQVSMGRRKSVAAASAHATAVRQRAASSTHASSGGSSGIGSERSSGGNSPFPPQPQSSTSMSHPTPLKEKGGDAGGCCGLPTGDLFNNSLVQRTANASANFLQYFQNGERKVACFSKLAS